MSTVDVKRENQDIIIIAERCKECGFCIKFCPQHILRKSAEINSKGYHPVYVSDIAKCTKCDICGMICPDFAISVVDIDKKPGEMPADSQPGQKPKEKSEVSMSERKYLAGEFFMSGDDACAEGAISAGCRFFAGYPITPASEIAERMSQRLPEVGGTYIQMEDELGSMAAILGASWGGAKAMTATSGPGFSLMMENIGLGIMTETPCVVVNIQRAGPSTGLPTLTGQGVT